MCVCIVAGGCCLYVCLYSCRRLVFVCVCIVAGGWCLYVCLYSCRRRVFSRELLER